MTSNGIDRPALDENAVPKIPEGMIRNSLGKYIYWYNPSGESGIVVFRGFAAKVINLCDNCSTIGQIRSMKVWSQEEKDMISEVFWNLSGLQMVTINPISEFFAARRKEKRRKNFTVWIQLTDQCNLRCPYCYIDKTPHSLSRSLAIRGLETILREIEIAGYTDLTIKYGGGEPTLCWRLVEEIVEWTSTLRGCNVKIHHSLLTNGYFLSGDMINTIKKTQIDVSISLDGIGDVHDMQRPTVGGKGSFSDIHSNIVKLSEAGVKPFIMTTVTRHNQSHLHELAEYCTERGMGFRLSLYRGKAVKENDFIGDHNELADDLVRFYEWFGNHLPEESLYKTHRFCDINLLRPKIANCGIGKSSIVIDANGDLAICQYQMEKVVGSLARGDSVLASLENQEFYQPDRDSARFVDKCSSCQWLYTCANGCPLHIKAVHGTFMRESPYCSVYKTVLPVLIRTHAKQIIRKGGDFDE